MTLLAPHAAPRSSRWRGVYCKLDGSQMDTAYQKLFLDVKNCFGLTLGYGALMRLLAKFSEKEGQEW